MPQHIKTFKVRHRYALCLFQALCACLLLNQYANAQIMEDGDYLNAIKTHTRSKDGRPGDKYWQNTATYTLSVTLNKNKVVSGRGDIMYFNNSPDTLTTLRIKLYQNLHRLGTLRLTAVDSGYFTSGMHITQLDDSDNAIDYLQKKSLINYLHDGTEMELKLSKPILPHDTLNLTVAWFYTLNNSKTTAPRESIIDSTTAFIAYWYPRIAVYDDVEGWDESVQNETSEFYNDFCTYSINITMPENYSIFATGNLASINLFSNQKTWLWKAQNVTDFVWAASKHYIADTTYIDLKEGKKTIITAYTGRKQFPKVIDVAKMCIEFYSKVLPGIEFPFEKLTIFEGRSQMEYPMMINDNDEAAYTDMATLTAHEISHMYFPFLMGINETRYGWMDEGWATFFEYHFMHDGLKSESGENTFINFYHRLIKQFDPIVSSIPLMAPSDQLSGGAYAANCYTKGWLMYETLRNVMGDSLFRKTLMSYIQTWRGKHPTPYDFFSYFKSASHEDLNWIFNDYAFHFGTFDMAIDQVKEKEGEIEVSIKNIGGLPMPLTVELKLGNGRTNYINLNAKVWQHKSENMVRFKLPKKSYAYSIHISTGIYPDILPSNNDYFIGTLHHKHKHHKHDSLNNK